MKWTRKKLLSCSLVCGATLFAFVAGGGQLPSGVGASVGLAGTQEVADAPYVIADPSTYDMREYPLPAHHRSPTPQSRAHSITVAPDGRVWYAGLIQNNLGMFDPATETFRTWDTLTQPSRPHGIHAAPDGMIWLTTTAIPIQKIARFDPTTETFTEYPLPLRGPYPHTLWVARDGTVYFSLIMADAFGRIDPATGAFTHFPIATKRGSLYGIQEGPDGNIWGVEFLANKVARLNTRTGEVTEWLHPRAWDDPGTRRPAVDAQGVVWFTEHEVGAIGRFDPATETWKSWWMPRIDGRRDQAYAINADSKGQLWVSNFGGNYVGRFDPISESWTVYPHVSRPVNCRLMAIDTNDVLWCAGSATPVLVRLEAR